MVDKFKDYFHFAKVFVITDNNPLSFIKSTKKLGSKEIRWLSQINQFDYEMEYRPGAKNIGADILSRMRHDTYESGSESSTDALCLSNTVQIPLWSTQRISELQSADFDINVVRNIILTHTVLTNKELRKVTKIVEPCIKCGRRCAWKMGYCIKTTKMKE
jgi:hypothetical protein